MAMALPVSTPPNAGMLAPLPPTGCSDGAEEADESGSGRPSSNRIDETPR